MIEVNVSMEALIRSELGGGKRVGRRSFWLCPFHQDRNPSLTVTPDGKHWKCFGCQKHGDAIGWVRERHGVSFREAVDYLGGDMSAFSFTQDETSFSHPGPRSIAPPSDSWMRNATAVISECELGLLNPEGSGALQLLCDRGLTYYTIRSHNLGYNPRHQTQHGLYVREGITIPWTENGSVRGIKVRQPNKEPKYVWVGGSRRAGLFLGSEIQAGLPTLVVEGEFDALLGSQSIRDLVNVVTLGSASESPDQLACQQLLTSPLTLVCYDNDPAGKSGSLRWTSLSGRVRFTNLPYGKDLTDFWRAGGDLRAWITGVLKEITTDPTRHPTVAVSGINDNQVGVG